jgi:multidrug efflux pump subunit AcrB
MPSIATVYVEVVPETAAIAKGIEKALRGVDARRIGRELGRELKQGLTDPTVELKADTTKARKKIDEATKDQKATVEVDADTAAANLKIDEAARDRHATIHVDVDKDRLGAMGLQAGAAIGTLTLATTTNNLRRRRHLPVADHSR